MEAIKVNLIPNGIPQMCHASQYDVGRQIRLDLFDGFTPYVIQSGDTFTLNVRKPDNHVVTATVTGTESNTYLVIETTEQMTAVMGKNLCEIRVENGGDNIGSLNFIMQVEKDVIANGVPSESVIEDLDALVAEAVETALGDDYYNKTEIDEKIELIDNTTDSIENKINQIARNGYYIQAGATIYIGASVGYYLPDGSYSSLTTRANAILTPNEMQQAIRFDTSIYKVNICYKNNGSVASYTSWITDSPLSFRTDLTYDTIILNIARLDDAVISNSELGSILYYIADSKIGELVTQKDIADLKGNSGLLQIYPDGFTSRIKPNIYLSNRYYADINTDDYKISSASSIWVSLDGNDTTGDGTEEKPFLTITKALTLNPNTIEIKEGTYQQGTHYTTSVVFTNINVIGHGEVILQNDSSGHYVTIRDNAYVENIIFKHGNTSVNSAAVGTCSATNKTVCFVNCVFRDGGANGLSILGVDAIVKNCIAYGNKLDGFNYHAGTVDNNTVIPNILEIDCKAYNNGTSSSGNNSCNGSTSHDGTKIIRLNGEYYSCYGGVIADIAISSGEKTKSVNFGVVAHESTGVSSYSASFWASTNTEMYLYDCKSYGGDYDLSATDDAIIVSRRLTTGRNVPSVYKGSSANVYQY